MKMKCPTCNVIIKEFTPMQSEMSYFENVAGRVFEAKDIYAEEPCKDCKSKEG